MAQEQNFHMSAEELRRAGYALIDWIIDYHERIEDFPVLSQVAPGDVRTQLPATPPQHGESFDVVMADVERIILPGVTHWQSPDFFAFFPANVSGPGMLGDLLSSGLGVQGMIWATSPACTELETHMMDWLVAMLGLPQQFLSSTAGGGVIQDSASSATLCALIAARERATRFRTRDQGLESGLVAYASSQAHSSLAKAMMVAGIGRNNLHLVAVDDQFALRPDALAARIARDKAAGLTPFFVMANVGTTSSGALDPIRPMGEICRAHDLWFHVDAAMHGSAAICPEFRAMHDGVELADSYTFNPHKWLFTNFDCNAFFVADRAALINALSISPEYLRNAATESGAVIDYRDWQIPLGRRFRALKLWFVIRHYGVAGLQHHIRQHVALAQEFAAWVAADSNFELVVTAPLNLVCFRHVGGDAVNQALLERLNATGALYLTHTRLADQLVLRMSIGQAKTKRRHVLQAWALIKQISAELRQSSQYANL